MRHCPFFVLFMITANQTKHLGTVVKRVAVVVIVGESSIVVEAVVGS